MLSLIAHKHVEACGSLELRAWESMFLFLSVTCLFKNHWFLSRMQLYFITQCLAKINVSGTCEWGKISVETLQYLNTKIALGQL